MKEKNKKKVVKVSPFEASLKRRLRRHLKNLGFRRGQSGELLSPSPSKDAVRTLHARQRSERLAFSRDLVRREFPRLEKHFASGSDVDPNKISPVLQRIYRDSWESELFRLASLTWSVPVSHGFGRRLRYLVWDSSNDKLIGLIAIGDPVFNLAVRDNLIGWNAKQRAARLVNMMDAYVLGAVPPYNTLLAGKMVSCLVRSREIFDDFSKQYGNTRGIISGKAKHARLLGVVTSSSMGRSSVYNRLKLGGVQYFKSIGYTSGWGHFHIPDALFTDLRRFLRENDHRYADDHEFGQGPNWKLRTTKAALIALGLNQNLLRHGVKREVFLCTLASNAVDLLRSGRGVPDLSNLATTAEIGALARERWLIPRSTRRPEFTTWEASQILDTIRATVNSSRGDEQKAAV